MGTVTKSRTRFNIALFDEAMKEDTFTNLLTDDAPKAIKSIVAKNGDKKSQTGHGAPIVRMGTFDKGADKVEVDIFHHLSGTPIMGDDIAEGSAESMTEAHFEMKIDQWRKGVDTGGRMTQQKTEVDIRNTAKMLLASSGGSWFNRFRDQRTLYHLAGARGSSMTADDVVPLEGHPKFSKIMVNPITPPTHNRYILADKNATDLSGLDASDVMDLDVVERTKLMIDETEASRIQPIRMSEDKGQDGNPLYLMYLSPRQMNDLLNSASDKDIQMMTAAAMKRSKGFDHPLFRGDCYMWRSILIKVAPRYVRFGASSMVNVSENNKDATVTQVQAAVDTHRAILLGAQALATGFGSWGTTKEGNTGLMGMIENSVDMDNRKEIFIGGISGEAKIRLPDKDGYMTDRGVYAIDTAVSA